MRIHWKQFIPEDDSAIHWCLHKGHRLLRNAGVWTQLKNRTAEMRCVAKGRVLERPGTSFKSSLVSHASGSSGVSATATFSSDGRWVKMAVKMQIQQLALMTALTIPITPKLQDIVWPLTWPEVPQ